MSKCSDETGRRRETIDDCVFRLVEGGHYLLASDLSETCDCVQGLVPPRPDAATLAEAAEAVARLGELDHGWRDACGHRLLDRLLVLAGLCDAVEDEA